MKQRKKKKKYLFSQKIGQFICFFCLFELGSSTSMGKVEEQKMNKKNRYEQVNKNEAKKIKQKIY